MKKVPPSIVIPGHPDYELLHQLRETLERIAGGAYNISLEIPKLFRRGVDEVIDTPRTGRRSFSELEKTEKTYIGTKMEILIRDFFGLPRGRLDAIVDGYDVDIKNTTGGNWMIPPEAVGKPCILLACDENNFRCFFGLVVARIEYLGRPNRDQKRSFIKSQFANIMWLLREYPYPSNFWVSIAPNDAVYINETARADGSRTSGNERLIRLFTKVLEKPIHRNAIQDVARQLDYMKRLRRNGGARDELLKQGVLVLWGGRDSEAIRDLGLPDCSNEEFIAVRYQPKDLDVLTRHELIN